MYKSKNYIKSKENKMAEDYFMKHGQGGATSTDTGMFDAFGNYLGKQSLGDITGTVGLGLGTFDSLFGMGSKVAKEGLKSKKMSNELLGLNIDATKQAKLIENNSIKVWLRPVQKLLGLVRLDYTIIQRLCKWQ